MAVDTDLNVSPYFDDFNEEKNFHRVLFKPSVAVQARELTQLQTILQNQIERFGDNILREGTIIKGCNFVEVPDLGYIKILDLQTNGQPVSMSTYLDARAVGVTTGIEAKIVIVETGLQTQSPDLNTIFVKYLTSGNSGEKEFSDTENIEIRNFSTNELIATVVAAGSTESNSVGAAYGVRVGDGIIYQKGFFVRVEEQIQIVSKYTNYPDRIVVGFDVNESIINSNNDTSLLDNANGFNNFNAPGADRLKLTATLVRKNSIEAKKDEKFFAIQEYVKGSVVRRNKSTEYSGLMEVMNKRTREESGNYTVKNFPINVAQNTANTEKLDVLVGAGTAYVEGRRIELLNTYDLQIDKATDFLVEEDQSIATNIGQYIVVDEFLGNFDPNIAATIDLYDTAQNAATGGTVPGTPTGNKIGEAKIRSFLYEDGTIGNADAQYRAYIFDIQMNTGKSFSEVLSIYYPGTGSGDDGVADLVSNQIFEPSFARSLFPVGRDGIKSVPASGKVLDFIFRTVNKSLNIDTSGNINITLSEGEWPYTGTLNNTQKKDIILITTANQSPYEDGKPVDLTSATVTVTSTTTLSITGLSSPVSSVPVIGYYNVKKSASQPAGKDLEAVYVKIDCSNNVSNTAVGEYSLGLPDVYEIDNIYVGSTYSTSNPDRKTSFTFNTGQKDTHYGLSSIKKKASLILSGTDKILVKAKVFRKNTSGSFSDGFFTVNSYPIDDANTANTAAITTEQIPRYTSETGQLFDLRNTIDFRPYCQNTASYSSTEGSATINPSSTLNFGTNELYISTPNEQFETDYEYYLARKDLIIINEEPNFSSLRGTPSENPVPPTNPTTGMVLATINIPVYPSLPKIIADRADRSDLGVTVLKKENKRYTMEDIGKIDRRVKNIEYYTALNALEINAKDLLITDASGNDRFKNGIFVDNFEDFSTADVKNDDFNAGIDPVVKEITPKFKLHALDMVPYSTESWSNVTNHGEAATLEIIAEDPFIDQVYSTSFRSCTTDFYKFNGEAQIFPEYDGAYDTNQAPALNIDVDLTTPFTEFTNRLSQFVPLVQSRVVSTRTSTIGASSTSQRVGNQIVTTNSQTTRTSQTIRNDELIVEEGNSTRQEVGNFITDFRFQPFLRARPIRIFAAGLKPNTRHYFYFDQQDINEFVAPGELTNSNIVDMTLSGPYGTPITTDASGNIFAIFRIPEETFYVGDRVLKIIDVDDLTSEEAFSSSTSITYRGFNFEVDKRGINVTTRTPEFNIASSSRTNTSTRTVVNTVRQSVPVPPPPPVQPVPNVAAPTRTSGIQEQARFEPGDGGGGDDPISQTFTVKLNHTDDTVVMLTKADVYFNQKSPTRGVTFEIRETENGFPTSRTVPFSKVHLNSNEVNVSADGSVATTFTFKAPVTLKAEVEYCFVVKPDANDPDYRIWIARSGESDTISGTAVTQDAHDGTLFTSTNDSAWTPYQDENIKFTLYKAEFADNGAMKLSNKNTEFFTLDNISGDFIVGEEMFVVNANVDGNVSVSTNSKTITGTGLSVFNNNDKFAYYANSTIIDVLTVDQVVSNTEIIVKETPKYANTNTTFFKTVSGTVTYYDRNTPSQIYIDNSNARSGTYNYLDTSNTTITAANYFEANTMLMGESSGATADIVSVDNFKVSYIQTNFYVTSFDYTNYNISADRLIDENTETLYADGLPFNMSPNSNNYLRKYPTIIKSRSNEIVDGSGKSLSINIDLENTSPFTAKDASPFVDHTISSIMAYGYQINNIVDDGSVTELDGTENGPAESKYISKRIILGDGFDADDLRLYMTAYRPPATDIKVYIRFKNLVDPRDFNTIEWTELLLKNETNLFSTESDRFDYREFEFYIPSQPSGDFVAGGGAALNSDNNDVIRYISPDGTIYDNYKSFAIKIVMLSTSHKNVPRIKNIRSIALT